MSEKKDLPEIPQPAQIVDVTTSQSFPQDSGFTLNDDGDGIMEDNGLGCAGKHFIVDFWGAKFLKDVHMLDGALRDAASAAGAVLLHIHLHKFSSGGGVTGVALLAESHISVHTWPGRDYAAFDVFMCGNAEPEKAVDLLKDVFKPGKVEVSEILRGSPGKLYGTG